MSKINKVEAAKIFAMIVFAVVACVWVYRDNQKIMANTYTSEHRKLFDILKWKDAPEITRFTEILRDAKDVEAFEFSSGAFIMSRFYVRYKDRSRTIRCYSEEMEKDSPIFKKPSEVFRREFCDKKALQLRRILKKESII